MTRIPPHLWYIGKTDEAAAFDASKVEPGMRIEDEYGRLKHHNV